MTVDRETAIEHLKRAAFTTEDGDKIVHMFRGMFGADWTLDGAVDEGLVTDAHGKGNP